MRRGGMTAVTVTGVVSQGAPIANVIGERLEVPADKIEPHELLYKVGSPAPHEVGLRTGDLLIIEQRSDGHSATAELVIATVENLAFIGRWWGKYQRRALMDESLELIAEDARLHVLGVINVVMRPTQFS
jgi:hypothetical protein